MSSNAKSFKIMPSESNNWPQVLFDYTDEYIISKQLDSLGSLIGVFSNYEMTTVPEMEEGRFFSSHDFLNNEDYAVIGKNLLKDTKIIEGKRFYHIENKPYEVIGIIKYRKDYDWTGYRCYINLKSVIYNSNFLWTGNFGFDTKNDVEHAYQSFKESIEKEGFSVIDFKKEVKSPLLRILNNIRFLLFVFVTILFIFIVNTVSVTTAWIESKYMELGVKKCFGANNIHICLDVVKKIFFIGVISFVIGVVVYSVLSLLLYNNIQIYFYSLAASFLITFITALLTSICPIIKSFKIEPVEMLR
jgi:putative ABC transport system permease protein